VVGRHAGLSSDQGKEGLMEGQSSKKNHRNSTVSLVVGLSGYLLATVILWFNQNATTYEYYVLGNAVLLFFIPSLIIFALGEDHSNFGLTIGNWKQVKWWVLAMYGALLIIFIPFSKDPDFQGYYPIFRQFSGFMGGGPYTGGNSSALVYGWLSYGLYMFFWEFFYRGYLLVGVARSLKWGAIIVQTIPFVVLHWGKPSMELVASLPAGIILGVLAMRSKSFVPGFLLHWAAQITFDVLVMVGKSGR
jgi:hypothetical protein